MNRNRFRFILAVSLHVLAATNGFSNALEIRISGMIAFYRPSDNSSLLVMLPNEYSQYLDPSMPMVHVPQLEIRCDQLLDARDREDCALWTPVPIPEPNMNHDSKLYRRALSLDGGIAVEIFIDGVAPSKPVDFPADYYDLLVGMQDLKGAPKSVSVLRKEAVSLAGSHVLSKLKLRDGSLELIEGDEKWHFFSAKNPGDFLAKDSLAVRADWKLDLDQAKEVEVRLTRVADGKQLRSLKLSPKDPVIWISNEPDALDFCIHAPEKIGFPFEHFAAFYDLTTYAQIASQQDYWSLPQAYPVEPWRLCPLHRHASNTGYGGRRVNCMMVSFSTAE